MLQLKAKTQEEVIKAMDKLEKQHRGRFKDVFKTITCDNGGEFLNSTGMETSCLKNEMKRKEPISITLTRTARGKEAQTKSQTSS